MENRIFDESNDPRGKRHLNYLRKHRPVENNGLLMDDRLNDHLATIDRDATSCLDVLIRQI